MILGLELVASRIMTPFFGVSLNVWSSILSVTLVGLAIGYHMGGVISKKLSYENLVIYFLSSGSLSAIWLNFSSFSYPFFLPKATELGFIFGGIFSCVYILFIPLVVLSSLNSVLVEISSRKVKIQTGYSTGSVFFVSTIGSVFGVFVSSYYLLPNFSNFASYSIISGSLSFISIVFSIFITEINKKIKIKLCMFGCLMILISIFNITKNEKFVLYKNHEISFNNLNWKIVDRIPSFYGNHVITDYQSENGSVVRSLITDGLINNQVNMSGISANNFPHILEALVVSQEIKPRKVLLLGLGVGIISGSLEKYNIQVDAVELDPKVIDIANKYFSLNKQNTRIFIEDARTFIRSCPEKYDAIIIDIFKGDGVPAHIVSEEFFQDVRRCMKTNATVSMNAFYGIDKKSSKHSLLKTIVNVFGQAFLFEENLIPHSKIRQGYIHAKKVNGIWNKLVTLNSVPIDKRDKIGKIIKQGIVYQKDSKELFKYNIISDSLNDWKEQNREVSLSYRELMIKAIPSEVLLN